MTDPNGQAAARPQLARGSPAGLGIDLAFLLKTLRRQFRFVALIVAGGLFLTFCALLLATPRYTATATILFDMRQQKVFSADTVLPGLTDDLYILESQLEILRSPRIANRVIRDLQARGVLSSRDSSPRPRWFWQSWFWQEGGSANSKAVQVAHAKLPEAPPAKVEDASPGASPGLAEQTISSEVIVGFLKGLVVERKGRSYIVEVSYTADNAERAADIANAFVDAYMADQIEAKFHATRNANLWLKERMQEIAREQEISEHVQQLIAARAHAAEATARLSQVRSLTRDPAQLLSLDVALQSTVISDYRRQASVIQRKITENVTRHGDQHPSVVDAKAQLDSLYKDVAHEFERIVDNRKLALEAATGKIKLLELGLRRLTEGVPSFDEHQVKLAEFKREATVSNELYSSLLRRYKETRAQEKLQTADARIVSTAAAPQSPSYPKKSLVLMLASVAWLGIGAGLGLARELKHRTLRSPADVETALGVECVATIPAIDLTAYGTDEKPKHNLSGPIHWLVDDNQAGDFSQAIFSLRKWTESCGGRGARIVLVVAANPAEGCSTVAAQLALYAANTGTRTVVVDADLRSRGLSDVLGLDVETSFPDAILSGCDPKSAIVRLPDTELHFCSAPGHGTWRPLDVLGSRAAGSFLGALRDEFDLIVIDTPPLAKYVDAHALVEYADCVLVVVRAGQTHQNDVTEIVQRMSCDAGLAIGVVLNMAKSENKG